MEAYASALGKDGTPEDCILEERNLMISNLQDLNIANYYENRGDYLNAGHFLATFCGQYPKALKLFIQCGEKAIDKAIAVVKFSLKCC